LPTDILGAAREELDCLFITGGIHDDQIAGDDFAAEASQLLSDHQTHARYAMTTLRW
jgi:ribonucleotide monophosphatase NagD (HAD superfamily)